ncbi:hypothetical protein FB451DRAFT_1416391 [Mycena latifolia]|nr:hypothetical protein FB451DRAFT_1416391 [Mycena latifolia]
MASSFQTLPPRKSNAKQTSHYVALPVAPRHGEDSPTHEEGAQNTPLLPPSGPARHSGLTVDPDSNYSYSYGPPGLAGLWPTIMPCFALSFASIGGLSFGYDQGVVILHPMILRALLMDVPQIANKRRPTAVLELGALFGALASGVLQTNIRAGTPSSRHAGALFVGSPVLASPPCSLLPSSSASFVGFWLGFFTRHIPSSLSWRLPLGIQIAPVSF